MAADEAQNEAQDDSMPEATIEPFLDMRDPTFRRILRAATSKFNQSVPNAAQQTSSSPHGRDAKERPRALDAILVATNGVQYTKLSS